MSGEYRAEIRDAKRLVVKVGSSSLGEGSGASLDMLVDAITAVISRGTEVVLVSSGAIATALPLLDFAHRPEDLATQQAAAAVGQSMLIGRYQKSLNRYSVLAGQVLLTAGDMDNPTHRANAHQAIERLLAMKVLPIVNENDTVATQEIRFGDNDRLAALVAQLVNADALVLLSDVDCLYTAPPDQPGAEPIDTIAVDDDLSGYTFGSVVVNSVGTGGAATKVTAARAASSVGIGVLVTATDLAASALAGHRCGTWFQPDSRG